MNSRRDYRTDDGIEEDGIRAYSTTEIDEVDNDTAEDVLQDSVNMLKRVGISGPGFEGMHDDEIKHSIAPIINENLAALSFAKPSDPTVSGLEADSIPDSEEWMSDFECAEKPDEDLEDSYNLVKEVCSIFDLALETGYVADVPDRVNKIRESYDEPGFLPLDHLFNRLMKSVLDTSHDSEEEFNKCIEEMIIKWKDPLKYFIYERFIEFGLISQLEEICLSISIAFSPFRQVLSSLYKHDLVHKNTILFWADDIGWEYGSNETFVKESQDLVEMLKKDSDTEEGDPVGEMDVVAYAKKG